MNSPESCHFQVNLKAIIELLSSHLYSGPEVFVRELLQNGVDAIRARAALQPDLEGHIELELVADAGGASTLIVEDNGIGLTADEVHRFVATIGSSSKRDDLLALRSDYIGQFGIGLLSCFLVTDEIVLLTCSAREPDAPAVEWHGYGDGSYTLREVTGLTRPGAKIYLRSGSGKENYFRENFLIRTAQHFGSLLPFQISVVAGTQRTVINRDPPWRLSFATGSEKAEHYRNYGLDTFETDFFDFVPLADPELQLEGAAYILADSPSLTARKLHRVYLKEMLLTENAENLLPEWGFFARCVINSRILRPTASREGIYEDSALDATREYIGRALQKYITEMARFSPDKLAAFIRIHSRAMKSLALHDDDFLLMIIDLLPFQTSLGELTLPECRKKREEIRFVSGVDDFRQISDISAAEGVCVINAGYVYDTELLTRLGALAPDRAVDPISPDELMARLDEVTLKEAETFYELIRAADHLLQRFKCRSEVRRFQPETTPCLYVDSGSAQLWRSVSSSKEQSDSLWSGVLGNAFEPREEAWSQLCFNAANPLVQKLQKICGASPSSAVRATVEVLYVQALLLARRTPTRDEMRILNSSMSRLVELASEHPE